MQTYLIKKLLTNVGWLQVEGDKDEGDGDEEDGGRHPSDHQAFKASLLLLQHLYSYNSLKRLWDYPSGGNKEVALATL